MSEIQVGFLYKAASSISQADSCRQLTVLKSFYLMRCKQITKGYGLPEKQFSQKVRCSRCCVEWKKGTQIRIRSIKLSKKQRQRIKLLKASKGNKQYVKSKKDLLHSNEVEQLCTFCEHSTITSVLKPKKLHESYITHKPAEKMKVDKVAEIEKTKTNKNKLILKSKENTDKKTLVNVYSLTKDVFSLKHKKNTIQTATKVAPKVIQNNKKKKVKYAGLCQKAVLASVKLKEEKAKQDKLSLFLKPSSS